MKILYKISDYIDSMVKWIIILIMILIPSAMSFQVVIRYVFNYPLSWVEELVRAGFVWLVFMTTIAALKRGEIVAMDFFLLRLPRKLILICRILICVLILAFLAIVCYSGVDMTWFTIKRGTLTSALQMPQWIIYFALPMGCILMGFQIFLDMLCLFFGGAGSAESRERLGDRLSAGGTR